VSYCDVAFDQCSEFTFRIAKAEYKRMCCSDTDLYHEFITQDTVPLVWFVCTY